MQTYAHTPANAQHIPAGWSFPQPSAAMPPQPAAPQAPVSGGGAPAATVTRMRWGRVLPVLAGLLLLGFGIWTATSNPGSAASRDVAGGGSGASSELDVTSSTAAANDSAAADSTATDPVVTPPKVATPATRTNKRVGTANPGAGANRNRAANNNRAANKNRAANRNRAAKRGGGAAVASGNAFATASADAAGARRTARGGGANGELPMTGLSTWIAAALGVLLLALGVLVQVNAVRIGARAMLYRRGILLRPTECAALVAQTGNVARLRVLLSNALDKLLEEPAQRDGQFVTARHAL